MENKDKQNDNENTDNKPKNNKNSEKKIKINKDKKTPLDSLEKNISKSQKFIL